MRRVRLKFASTDDVWNFLVLTKIKNIEVAESCIMGFFTRRELEVATIFFKAEHTPYPTIDVLGEQQIDGFYLR